MISIFHALILAILLSATQGCGVSMFSAKTKASWTDPGGKTITYESDKEQIGLDATFDPKTGYFHVKVDKAGTNEAAIAAAAKQSEAVADVLKAIIPLIEKAALTAATKGAVP